MVTMLSFKLLVALAMEISNQNIVSRKTMCIFFPHMYFDEIIHKKMKEMKMGSSHQTGSKKYFEISSP